MLRSLLAVLSLSLLAPAAASSAEVREVSLELPRLGARDLLRPARPRLAAVASSATSEACVGGVAGDGRDDTGPLGSWGGPVLAYQDNGDGTFTDLNTQLMWEVKVVGGGNCLDELHAVDAACDWNEATGAWIDALNAEGGTGFAGYSDWRLPNIKELQSLVDFGEVDPAIDALVPGETADQIYWSATQAEANAFLSWRVNFAQGIARLTDKTLVNRVRAVRGGP